MLIELDRKTDGRWIADFLEVKGVMAYGKTPQEAIKKAMKIYNEVAKTPNYTTGNSDYQQTTL